MSYVSAIEYFAPREAIRDLHIACKLDDLVFLAHVTSVLPWARNEEVEEELRFLITNKDAGRNL